MNAVLLMLNVFLGAAAVLIYLTPGIKRSIGIKLLASAKADELRAQHYKQLKAQYQETH